jgi:hypothetical protein
VKGIVSERAHGQATIRMEAKTYTAFPISVNDQKIPVPSAMVRITRVK